LLDLAPRTSIIVKDLLGRSVFNQPLTQNNGYLEIGEEWQAGVYIVQIVTDNAASEPIKIIKKSN